MVTKRTITIHIVHNDHNLCNMPVWINTKDSASHQVLKYLALQSTICSEGKVQVYSNLMSPTHPPLYFPVINHTIMKDGAEKW